MVAAVLEIPACACQVKSVFVEDVGNEDLAVAVDHLRLAERVAVGSLVGVEADLGLDKNISGCPQMEGADIVLLEARLLEAADRRTGTGLAEAELRAGAAGIADQKGSKARRWHCLGYVEYGSCGLCSHVGAPLGL